VDLGVGEVGRAAGVVEVEVGAGNVADVGRIVAERANLLDRRLGGIRLDVEPATNGTPRRRYGCRMSSAPKPVSIRTSDSPASTSRQWQTIFAGPRPPSPLMSGAVGAERAAVEVVDGHRSAHRLTP
jgi:hypothetical protein